MKTCEKCGIPIPRGRLCQTCQKYKRNGGVWHPLPAYGTVEYDDQGRPICHLCGMAFDKLIEHTIRKHHLDSMAYRERFGLMRTARLTSPKYAVKMHDYTQQHKTHEKNFEPIYSGKLPRGVRRNPKWSPQETVSRIPQQITKGKLSKSKLTPERLKELSKIWGKNLPNHRKEDVQ